MISPELTRNALFDAMQARRMYSTDDPDIEVTFKCGEAWMGSSVDINEDTISFFVNVKDNEIISKIELFTNQGALAEEFTCNTREVSWSPTVELNGDDYFYIVVTEENTLDEDDGKEQQIAVSAPIWVN